jgi:hypothetical protein
LLVEVVVEDDDVTAFVAEALGHRDAGVRRRGTASTLVVRGGRDDDRVRHRAGQVEAALHVDDRRLLLPHRDVDADHLLGVLRVAAARRLLVDDRVDAQRRLAGLTVADDQLALSAADRDHRVDGLDAGLQRLLDGLALDDRRCRLLDRDADRSRSCRADPCRRPGHRAR